MCKELKERETIDCSQRERERERERKSRFGRQRKERKKCNRFIEEDDEQNACLRAFFFHLSKHREKDTRSRRASRRMSTFSSSTKLAFFAFIHICILTSFTFGATLLPSDEVEALKVVGKKLGKVWNFSADPCSGQYGWNDSADDAVTCDCSYLNNTVCHVISIILRHQYLQGTLPPGLTQLPYLQTFIVMSNYLKGTIPTEWGSMPNLQLLALSENQLSGSIPKELGNVTTLTGFGVEDNQLSGVLPLELGNLHNLQKVFLNSNNFTGDLPSTFANLTSLRDLWLCDNQFTGKIPNFIGNWTNIERLVMEGSGLKGPIPSSIEAMKKLNVLRISDLNGPEGPFPQLGNLSIMKTLILRSCNLIGELPDYVGQMTQLLTLDVSFNKLAGELPSSLENLPANTYMYLTGNLFTGAVPDWIVNKGENIDLSYNNFTTEGSRCSERSVNLFASSSKGNDSVVSCLANLECPEGLFSLHINCGGKEIMIGENTYKEDKDEGSPTRFFQSKYNWAYSSTGQFQDGTHSFTWLNESTLPMENPELYMTARLSPLSLTYYGYCLMNRNYTVNLHFAEIIFTSDGNHTSLGRRIFDVYIQNKLMLKDFNIAQEAGGSGKPVVKNFTVPVIGRTLEIRLYWAGKGTISVPSRGFYGPLISAISVNPADFVPPRRSKGTKMSSYAIVGIVVAVAFVILLILGTYYGRGCLRRRGTFEEDLKGTDLQVSSFTFEQIRNATNNFAASNKIGEGGFGPVYKGLLSDGTIVAVKQLSSSSKQGNREFLNEIGMISALEHPHLVKLYGCCVEGNELLLVYEYLENNSLAHALFGLENPPNLDWSTRQRICLGIAKGLAYLHEESRLKIVHRDIKPTNILLDKNLNAKISDFGLAKLDEDKAHISTKIAGTFGYMAPEYAMKGYLTDKADVYSFGIVALEIVSGRRNTASQNRMGCPMLFDWARELKGKGTLLELVDPRLGSNFKEKEVVTMINVALMCTEVSLALRPTMSSVVSMLEGKIAVPSSVSVANIGTDKSNWEHAGPFEDVLISDTMTKSMSIGGTQTVSSTSESDINPLNLGSDVRKAW